MNRTVIGASAVGALFAFSGCPTPSHPTEAPAGSQTVEVGAAGSSLRGAASDGTTVFVSLSKATERGPIAPNNGTPPPTFTTEISARRGSTAAWTSKLDGRGGPLVLMPSDVSTSGHVSPPLVIASLAGSGMVAGAPVRGEPGAAIVALDPTSGTVTWRTALESNEWVTITTMCPRPEGGAMIGGAFSATLRVSDKVVQAGGRSDGFLLALSAKGTVDWLWRMGGTGADTVQGVAVRDGVIAVAGVYMNDAELGGISLPAFEETTPNPDAYVASLDEKTGKRVWAQSFGGLGLEEVAGVVIDEDHNVVVAATVRGPLLINGGNAMTTEGPAAGLVAWWNHDGKARASVLLGGTDFDGLRAITAVGKRVIVGGFYSGSMRLGGTSISAGGGDDAFLAALDATGSVVTTWPASGPGREELVTLSSIPGGFLVGATYTATANIAGAQVSAPTDPLSGAAVAIRPAP
ncbi:hypothetical protein BH11MYX2_BH11MYX2_22990 [soil metagenome]